MAEEAIRFARTGESKAVGCIVYLIGGLAAAVAIGCFAGMLVGAPLRALGASENAAVAAGLGAAILAIAGTLVLVWRNFRNRAFTEVLVYPDRLEIGPAKRRVAVPFAEIRSVSLKRSGTELILDLTTEAGRRHMFPAEIAPFHVVRPALEARLLPFLLRKIEETLSAGKSISLRESALKAFGRVVYGLFHILISPLIILSIRLAGRGIENMSFGAHLIRQGRRSWRGGFEVSADGLTPAGAVIARPIPWNEVTLEAYDNDGIVLRDAEGRVASASIYSDDYWPISLWIAGKARPSAANGGPVPSR